MSAVDTSTAAVDALCQELHFTVADLTTEIACVAAAATLRALAAERNAARADVVRLRRALIIAAGYLPEPHAATARKAIDGDPA